MNLRIIDVGNLGADLVKEITVMGNNDDRIVKIDQELVEPVDRIEIKMVRRLVEKKNIGIPEQCLCKKDLNLERILDITHHHVMIFRINSEAVKQRCRIGFRFPAVHLRELALKLRGTDTVFIGKILFGIYRILFLHDLIQALVSEDNGIKNGIRVILEVILLEEGQTLSRSHDYLALTGFKLPRKYFEESRFSCAVGAYKSVAVAFRKLDINILEQCALSEAKGYITCLNH